LAGSFSLDSALKKPLTDQLEENRFSKEPEVDLMEVSPAPIQMTATAMATTPVEVGTQVVV
jgi:hypothetical protein